MISTEGKNQFNEIFEELGKTLDITEEEHNAAVKSYVFVGEWLAEPESSLNPYKPEILPQGSFMLGTIVRPVNENEDLDIDLVCQLVGKRPEWTQYNVKNKVGDRLKDHVTLKRLLKKEEGRRCWTLEYADSANFHMDILPSIVSRDYKIILEKAFTSRELENIDRLAIRITDKEENNYRTEANPELWLKSNPFGYGKWFHQQATLEFQKAFSLKESVKPVPTYQKEKSPLQRVVQILKRHRNIMFNGDEDKPISIIITTLAARAYRKETHVIEALLNVIKQMPNEIKERYVSEVGKPIKWIANPVNEQENFADKWPENPQKQINFYKWMEQVSVDIYNALDKHGLSNIQEALEKPFGEKTINTVFSNYGEKMRLLRESGNMKMAASTGLIGMSGRTNIPPHSNFGEDA